MLDLHKTLSLTAVCKVNATRSVHVENATIHMSIASKILYFNLLISTVLKASCNGSFVLHRGTTADMVLHLDRFLRNHLGYSSDSTRKGTVCYKDQS